MGGRYGIINISTKKGAILIQIQSLPLDADFCVLTSNGELRPLRDSLTSRCTEK